VCCLLAVFKLSRFIKLFGFSAARISINICVCIKNGRNESLMSPDGVAPTRIVGVSASGISPCTIMFRRRFLLTSGTGSPV